jgi:hypothetical protein
MEDLRIRRTIVTYKPEKDTKSGKGLRLFLRNGVVMNPDVDAAIIAGIQGEEALTAVKVRSTGQATRFLVHEVGESHA